MDAKMILLYIVLALVILMGLLFLYNGIYGYGLLLTIVASLITLFVSLGK
jgi:hypothetical protein